MRFTAVLFSTAVIGWASASITVFFWAKHHQGITEARWIDIAVPANWGDFRRAQGLHLLTLANQQFEAGNFGQGFHLLRVGLSKHPEDAQGRLLLADIYKASKRADLAERVLVAGIPFNTRNLDYLQNVFRFLLLHQSDERVIETARNLFTTSPSLPAEVSAITAIAAATASYFRGNYDQAEDYLRSYGLESTWEGRLLAAKIDWERGYRELALFQLQRLYDEIPANDDAYQTSVEWLRELGRDDAARQVSLLRQINFPDDPRPRIELLYIYEKAGADETVDLQAESILRDFRSDSNALLLVADFAANTGRADLAQSIFEATRTHQEVSWEAPALMAMEAMVVAGDYQGAVSFARKLQAENPTWADRFYSVFNGLQSIAYFGLGDHESGQLFLSNFLSQSNLRAENLTAVSRRLITVGALAQAREVLEHAIQADPLNQASLGQIVQLDLDADRMDVLPDHLRRLLAMRKPSETLVREAYRKLGSDFLILRPDRDSILRELAQFLGSTVASRPLDRTPPG